MHRIAIILVGLASLVASGVIMDRGGRVGLNANIGLGVQTMQGIRAGVGGGIAGSGVVNTLTRDELLRQKFILDVLHQVYMPLQQQELLMLDDRSQVTNEDLYQRPLTQEMHMVLDMLRSQQMLGKQTICRINNEIHLQQMLGLYRLLVTARDFDTFKRLVVHARQNINTEMFVNALVLALGERSDTQMLIVPALYEILAQIYHKDQVIDEIAHVDTGVSSVRPQLKDVIGMRRQQGLWNSRMQEQQGGLLGVLNRSQLWMPWREFHKQMAWRKMVGGGNVVQQDANQMDKMVIPLPGNGLLSEDVGLKAYVNLLIDELIVNQDVIRDSNRNQRLGMGGVGRDTNEHGIWGNRGRINQDDNLGGLERNRGVNGEDYLNNQQGNILGGRQGINSDRLLFVGRRQRVDDDQVNRDSIEGRRLGLDVDELNRNRDINAGRRLGLDNEDDLTGNRDINTGRRHGLDIDIEHAMDRNRVMLGGRRQGINKAESDIHNIYGGYNNDQLISGRGLRNRVDLGNGQGVGVRNQQKGQNGINTVSVNDARLLFVGRRRKNPNNVVDTSGRNNYNDNDEISGGRRVAKEGKDNKEGRQWNKQQQQQDDDENTLYDIRRLNNERLTNSERYINVNRRGMMWDQNNDDEDNLYSNLNRGRNDMNVNSRYQQMNSDVYGQGQGLGRGMGKGRDDFLNVVTRGGLGQRQYYDQDQDLMFNHGNMGQYNRESLDMHLPTTSINDERLLHINRHKLSNVEEGRRVNSRQGDFDDDEDHSQTGQQRGKYNQAGSRLDEQSNWQRNSWAMNRQGYQNNRDNDNDNSKRGQNRGKDNNSGYRYRRSLLNQNQQLDNDNSISGKLLLHTLQQLVARLNVERIALGQPQLIANNQNNLGRGQLFNNLRGQITLNRNDIQGVDVQTANKIEEIIHRIDNVLQQRIGDISVMSYNQKVNEIGLLLAGQIQDIGLIQILAEIQQQGSLQQQQRKGQVANILENQAAQILLAGIVKVIDNKVQQVYKQREEFISTVHGVTINHVDVDQLQTYLEHAEIDLSNLLKNNLDQAKEVVGRVPRLNHKNFNIEVDVNSDRQQQVVVRNLLVPKVDGLGNIIPLQQRRQNVIVLDITTVELQPGHNLLTLRSNDITMTARDTTPLTQIYQHVMQALNGNTRLQQDMLVGQTNKLPHRLLLPRGRINGLPMQLITVITPVQRSAGIMTLHRGDGLDTLLLDRLPLNYPLHCDITDLDRVVSMPNLMVKDVKIYHDDNIKMPLSHLY